MRARRIYRNEISMKEIGDLFFAIGKKSLLY